MKIYRKFQSWILLITIEYSNLYTIAMTHQIMNLKAYHYPLKNLNLRKSEDQQVQNP